LVENLQQKRNIPIITNHNYYWLEPSFFVGGGGLVKTPSAGSQRGSAGSAKKNQILLFEKTKNIRFSNISLVSIIFKLSKIASVSGGC